MSVSSLLEEPGRVDEPRAVQEYAEVLSQVASQGKPVIVRRNGEDLAAVVPLEHLEFVREMEPQYSGDYKITLRDGTELSSSRAYRAQLRPLLRQAL